MTRDARAHWRFTNLSPMDIGATSNFLQYVAEDGSTTNIVVDSGTGFERTADRLTDDTFFPADLNVHVHAIIVTHGHLDHIGFLPRFFREHPEAILFATEETLRVAYILWMDALKIERAERRKARRYGESILPAIFTYNDVDKLLSSKNFVVVGGEDEWISDLPGLEGFSFQFPSAGHAYGAKSYWIVPPSGPAIFGTGDIALHDQELVPGAKLPKPEFLAEIREDCGGIIMVSECTNGERDPERTREEERKLMVAEAKRIVDAGGVVLNSTFSYGRGPAMAKTFADTGITVYLDGLARKFGELEIEGFADYVSSGKIRVFEKAHDRDSWLKIRDERMRVARGEHGGCAIVTGSATVDQGLSALYSPIVLAVERNGLFLTGHLFENTLAEDLVNAKQGDTVHVPQEDGSVADVTLRASVHKFDFSSHIYQSDIVRLVEHVSPNALILHHGEVESFARVSERIRDELSDAPEVFTPGPLEELVLSLPNGIGSLYDAKGGV